MQCQRATLRRHGRQCGVMRIKIKGMKKDTKFKNCPICGKFMRRLKLLEKARLSILHGTDTPTHICRSSTIKYSDGVVKHF